MAEENPVGLSKKDQESIFPFEDLWVDGHCDSSSK